MVLDTLRCYQGTGIGKYRPNKGENRIGKQKPMREDIMGGDPQRKPEVLSIGLAIDISTNKIRFVILSFLVVLIFSCTRKITR